MVKKSIHLKFDSRILDLLKTKHHLSYQNSVECALKLLMEKLEPSDPITLTLELKEARKNQMKFTSQINTIHEILKKQGIDPDNFEEEYVFPEIRGSIEV